MKQVSATRGVARWAAGLLVLGLAAGALSACNTVRGAGQDVSAAGNGISSGSDATKAKIQNSTQ